MVQAVLVVQLLFALPLGTLPDGRTPSGCDWLGTVGICLAIATLIVVRNGREPAPASGDGIAIAALGGTVIVGLLAAARLLRHPPTLRTVLVGAAAGVGFSITASFIVSVTIRIADAGLWQGLCEWPSVTLAASGVMAALLVQYAYASGSLPAALTAMTVADPVASWAWSLLILDQQSSGVTTFGAYLLAAALLTSGTRRLPTPPPCATT